SAVDALFFFGRDRDSEVIAANLMASRVTVLFGPTGVGKTSVLRAGVAYKLRQEAGVDVRIHSSWIGDPGEALANLTPSTGRDIYLMLDQFEEFFLYHEQNRSFVEELANVIRRTDLRVNVLIGIREDALALLDGFEAPYLQLVMSRLWEVEAERGSKLLRRETLTELGGATQIVQDHLEHAMADLSPRQKDAAAAMYNFLVTPSGSKIAHRTRDLAG